MYKYGIARKVVYDLKKEGASKDDYPANWRSETIENLQLVICSIKETWISVEASSYGGDYFGNNPTHKLYCEQHSIYGDIYSAKTGERVDNFGLLGGVPRESLASESFRTGATGKTVQGDPIPLQQVIEKNNPYVQP